MSALVIVAHVETSPTRCCEIEVELQELANATRVEQGCLHYQICRDLETTRGKWLIYEIWESETHFREHLATPHLQRFKNDVLSSTDVLRATKLKQV